MKDSDAFSHDASFKELVWDFPKETLQWLVPEAEDMYGPIKNIEFVREEMGKHWLNDTGREVDIPMKVTFESGETIISLIEHKGDKQTFSIYKLCHYCVDLAEIHEDTPIIPIVIFADPHQWRKDVKRKIRLEMFGESYLYFSFRKVKLKEIEAAAVQRSDNPVLHILTPLMAYPDSERYHYAVSAYINMKRGMSKRLFEKYMDFVDKYAKITEDEKDMLIGAMEEAKEGFMFREALMMEGRKEGEIKGLRKGKEEMAWRLFEEGASFELVLKVSGLEKERLMELKEHGLQPPSEDDASTREP